MISSIYEYLSILLVGRKPAEEKDHEDNHTYTDVLEAVRSSIAQNHSEELSSALDNADAAQSLKTLIYRYAAEYLAGEDYDRDAITERIYQDMAGLGLLTKYLYDPTVEEININSYDFVEVKYSTKTVYLFGEEAFASENAALDIVKRMVRIGGKLLDARTPQVDSFIGSGIRISAKIPPAVPKEAGIMASIRKQSRSRITGKQLIEGGVALPEMLDFLTMCLCNHVSVGIAGSTGSGKTSLQAFLANEYITKNESPNNRVYVIEDSRELNLIKYDVENDRPARVMYNLTIREPSEITMSDQVKSALRFDPELIIPSEVRDGAAYDAADAGQTGHTILTSFHADGAMEGYHRLVTLCHKTTNNLSDEQLLDECIHAWPILVFQKQLKDGSRKMMEIFEATGHENGKVQGNMLFRFVVEETERNGRGRITCVRGHHERCGCISPSLYKRLRDNGASAEKLKSIFPEGKPLEDAHEN